MKGFHEPTLNFSLERRIRKVRPLRLGHAVYEDAVKKDVRNGEAERVFRWVLTVEDKAPAHNGPGLIAIRHQDRAAVAPELGLIHKMVGDIPRAKTCFETFLAKASRAHYAQLIPRVREEVAAMR